MVVLLAHQIAALVLSQLELPPLVPLDIAQLDITLPLLLLSILVLHAQQAVVLAQVQVVLLVLVDTSFPELLVLPVVLLVRLVLQQSSVHHVLPNMICSEQLQVVILALPATFIAIQETAF